MLFILCFRFILFFTVLLPVGCCFQLFVCGLALPIDDTVSFHFLRFCCVFGCCCCCCWMDSFLCKIIERKSRLNSSFSLVFYRFAFVLFVLYPKMLDLFQCFVYELVIFSLKLQKRNFKIVFQHFKKLKCVLI